MRLMEQIRKHGDKGLKAFLVIFVISVFAGLGVGTYDFSGQGGSGQPDGAPTKIAVLDTAKPDIALVVNGREVEAKQLNERVQQYTQMMRGQLEDPQMMLYVYGQAATSLVQEEIILGQAQELGLKAEAKDFTEERQKVVDAQGTAPEAKATNVLSDLTQKVSQRREQKSVFNAALSRMGLTPEKWEAQVTREILQRKVREALQKDLDAAKDVKAKAKRDEIDAELAKGTSFKDAATKFSEAADSAKFGGDMQTWLMPGLLQDDKHDIVLMATPAGEMTPWFDIEAGYQRWEVYERVALDDKEFIVAKPDLENHLKAEKGDDYKPTDEELKPLAFKVKARQIMVNKTDPDGLTAKIEGLNKATVVEINNPYVLAYQALYDEKLQPVAAMGFDQLVTIAQKSAATADYNFEAIKGKLERGKPEAAAKADAASTAKDGAAETAEVADAATATDATAAPGDPASAEADVPAATPEEATSATANESAAGETTGTEPSDAAEEAAAVENPSEPIYALAVGLLMLALEGEGEEGASEGSFGQAVIAKVYGDWLDNETVKGQPLDRDAARADIETRLARALEKDDYNATLYAARGLNLAWLNKPEEAKVVLEKAEKFAPDDESGPLVQIKKAYEKLDLQDKVKAVQERMDKAREKKMQEQIERAMAQQQQQQAAGGTSAGAPINIDLGGGASAPPGP